MFYAVLFFLFGLGFAWAGHSIGGDSAVAIFFAVGFYSAAAAEFFTGSLYAAASLLRVNPGRIFKNKAGKVYLLPRALIWPYLIFEYRFWRRYRKQKKEPLYEQVTEGLWLGSLPTTAELPGLRADGVSAALDLVAEMSDPEELRREFRYLCLPTLDGCAPTLRDFAAGVSFVKECRAEGRGVLIHCTFGHGRSAALMAASLVALGEAGNLDEAMGKLKGLKRMIFLSREQRETLERFVRQLAADKD